MTSTAENPKLIPIKTAKADPRTEKAPFILHTQGMAAWEIESAIFIPVGKGIPMTIPRDDVIPIERAIRKNSELLRKYPVKNGNPTV